MADPFDSGSMWAGFSSPDDEDERKRRMLADLTPEPNAPVVAGAFGGGPFAAALSGAMSPKAPAASPYDPVAAYSAADHTPKTGLLDQSPKTPMVGPQETWNPSVYGPSGLTQYNFTKGSGGWDSGNPSFTAMADLPGAMPGASRPNPNDNAERIRQLYTDNLAAGPNVGWALADNQLKAQLAGLNQQTAIQGRLDEQKLQSQGLIDAANARHKLENSSDAMKTKMYSLNYGTTFAETKDPRAAHQAGLRAMSEYNPNASAMNLPPETGFRPREFGRSVLDIMTGGFELPGLDKGAPPQRGMAKAFGPEQAGTLVSRINQLPEDHAKSALEYVMKAPGVGDALTGRFAAQEMAQGYDHKAAPRGTGSGVGGVARSALDRMERNVGLPDWIKPAADAILPRTPDAYPVTSMPSAPGLEYMTSSPEEGEFGRAIQNVKNSAPLADSPYRFVRQKGKYIPLDRGSLVGDQAKQKAQAEEAVRRIYMGLLEQSR